MWSIAISFITLFYYASNALEEILDQNTTTEESPKELPDLNNRWLQGRIYFYIDQNFTITNRVQEAFNRITAGRPCPQFTELSEPPETPTFGRTKANTWLHFTNADGGRECTHKHSSNAYGEIKVNVGYDCIQPHQLLHTIMHALGFPDEVSHPQRDLFISVQWDNIQPAYRSLFRIRSSNDFDQPLLDYDPNSVMQFHDRAFSVNGQATIAPLLPGLKIAPGSELSHIDKMKLRLMFDHECKKKQISNLLNNCGKLDHPSLEHGSAADGNGDSQDDGKKNVASNDDSLDDSKNNDDIHDDSKNNDASNDDSKNNVASNDDGKNNEASNDDSKNNVASNDDGDDDTKNNVASNDDSKNNVASNDDGNVASNDDSKNNVATIVDLDKSKN